VRDEDEGPTPLVDGPQAEHPLGFQQRPDAVDDELGYPLEFEFLAQGAG
jgi:hypothetical protein